MSTILDSPRVRRILIAFSANRLGSWFGLVALLVVVFDHTHNALAVSALLLAWQALPAFAVPVLVARVEASARGHEMASLYFFEAVTTAALAALLWHFWLPGVLLLAALDGTAALASSALLRAELARAARAQFDTQQKAPSQTEQEYEDGAQEAERSANAALNIAFSVTFVAGPALAGLIVASAGAAAALFIDAGSFLVCGVLLIDLHPHVEEAGSESVRGRLKAAWQHINEKRSLRMLLLVYAVALAFFETAAPIEVAFAKATLHAGDRGLGLLLTSWGGGAVLGSIVFARLHRRPLALMLSSGTLAIGLADIGFAVAPTLSLACVAALIGGIGNGVELPALVSVVQQIAPSDLHGRLMGAVESLTALAVAVGLPLGGALVAVSSTRGAFWIVGIGTMLAAFALFRLSRPGAPPGLSSDEHAHPGAGTTSGLPPTTAVNSEYLIADSDPLPEEP